MVPSWISVQVVTTSPWQAFPRRGLSVTLTSRWAMKSEGGLVAQPPLWVFWPLCISQCLLLPVLAVFSTDWAFWKVPRLSPVLAVAPVAKGCWPPSHLFPPNWGSPSPPL